MTDLRQNGLQLQPLLFLFWHLDVYRFCCGQKTISKTFFPLFGIVFVIFSQIGIIFGSFAHPKTYEEKLSFSCFKIENENSSINKYVITFDCNEEVISEVICGDLKEPIRYYYKKALNVKLLS